MDCADYCKKCFETKRGCPACTTHWVPGCLKFLSFITCQCIKPVEDHEENNDECCPASCCCSCCSTCCKNCCIVMLYITIVVSVLLVIAISVYPTGAFIYGWANCPYRFSNSKGDICFTIAINDNTEPDIVLRDSGGGLINTNNTKEIQEFIDLTKIAILFSTLANGVSQIFFILALVCLFFRHCKQFRELNWSRWKKFKLYCCCTRDEVDDISIIPLDPFDDYDRNEFIEPTSIAVVYQHKLQQVITLDQQQGDQQQGDQQQGDQQQGDQQQGDQQQGDQQQGDQQQGDQQQGDQQQGDQQQGDQQQGDQQQGDQQQGDQQQGDQQQGDQQQGDQQQGDQQQSDQQQGDQQQGDQQQGDQWQGDQRQGDQKKGSFFSKQDTSTSTLLQGERLCHYNTWFAIGLVMMAAVGSIFFLVQYINYDYNQVEKPLLEISTTFLYAWSLIRTIVSCFIFSKLMYAIQRKCEEIEMYVYYTNDNINTNNNKIKEYVQTRFNSELKVIATEMLTFIESANDENNALKKKMSNMLMNRTELARSASEDEVYTAIYNASNNRSSDINVNTGTNQEKEIKKILKSVNYDDIKERQFIAQNDEGRNAWAARYSYTIDRLIKERAKPNENNDDGRKALALKYLKERDRHFVNTAVVTLSWLQLWFLLHWLLYIISTFMILTVLIDAVALHVKDRVPHIEPGVGFHPVQIVFLCLYSLVQCFVLVYPCLRAAGVTRTRQRVIRKINDEAYKFTNLPEGVIPEFIESMKRRKFGFRFRILCASITFNLNIAYLSIAFGFVGIVVSLVNSVTS